MVAEPPARPEPAEVDERPASETVPLLSIPMRWSNAVRPCALAALIASLAMVTRLMVPFIAAVGAGFLAVVFYRRNNPTPLREGKGARLGALCGLFCSFFTTIFGTIVVIVLHKGGEMRQMMLDQIQQSASRLPGPEYQPALDFMRSPSGLLMMTVFTVLCGMLILIVLASVGGAIGGALLGRRDKP